MGRCSSYSGSSLRPRSKLHSTHRCSGLHSALLTLLTLLPRPFTHSTTHRIMPAVRKTRKSAKAAADPYVKAETEASVKDETTTSGGEDKPKLNTSTSTYDRVQMFSDIIRVR